MQASRFFRFAGLAIAIYVVLMVIASQSSTTRPYVPDFVSQVWKGDPTIYTFAPSHLGDPVFPDLNLDHQNHKEINHQNLRDLHACMALGNCGPNQTKIVLFAGYWFKQALDGVEAKVYGEYDPEDIEMTCRALSMIKALRQMGYTFFISVDDWEETLDQYRMFPDLVKVVISPNHRRCIAEAKCIKSENNPTGIPRWKKGRANDQDLDWRWHIHADRYGDRDRNALENHYIGYSLEEQCSNMRVVPQEERPMSAWFFAKQATYAYTAFPLFAWNRSYFEMVEAELRDVNFRFRGAYQITESYFRESIIGGPMEPIPGIDNLGKLGPEAFANEIAKSRLLVGIGQPRLAPTPYLALCGGTPFLNVIKKWNHDDPQDRARWDSQHNYLKWMDPPFVYNVYAGDYDGFLSSVKAAVLHPGPPPFLDPEMTEERVRQRMKNFLETDWKSEAQVVMQMRMSEGHVYVR